jgi:tetratricopeptide (TPR) repeat protein
MRLGNMDQALNYLNQALEICRNALKDSACEANMLDFIGNLHFVKLNYQDAFKYYNQALEIRRKNQDLSGQAESLTNIAALLSKLAKHKEALKNLEEAQRLLDGKGTLTEQGLIIQEIGNVYSSLGDFQKAVDYHKQSRILFSQAGEKIKEYLSIGNIVSIYIYFIGRRNINS